MENGKIANRIIDQETINLWKKHLENAGYKTLIKRLTNDRLLLDFLGNNLIEKETQKKG